MYSIIHCYSAQQFTKDFKMRNSSSRRQFRNLAFNLQLASSQEKIIILRKMISVLKEENDKEEMLEMHKTICTNIMVHNLVIGLRQDEHNFASSVAADS